MKGFKKTFLFLESISLHFQEYKQKLKYIQHNIQYNIQHNIVKSKIRKLDNLIKFGIIN